MKRLGYWITFAGGIAAWYALFALFQAVYGCFVN